MLKYFRGKIRRTNKDTKYGEGMSRRGNRRNEAKWDEMCNRTAVFRVGQ